MTDSDRVPRQEAIAWGVLVLLLAVQAGLLIAKVVGGLEWPLLAVLAPLWVPGAAGFGLLLVVGFVSLVVQAWTAAVASVKEARR